MSSIRFLEKFKERSEIQHLYHNLSKPSKNSGIIQYNMEVLRKISPIFKISAIHAFSSNTFIYKLLTRCRSSGFNCEVSFFTKYSLSLKQMNTNLTLSNIKLNPMATVYNISAIFGSDACAL